VSNGDFSCCVCVCFTVRRGILVISQVVKFLDILFNVAIIVLLRLNLDIFRCKITFMGFSFTAYF